MSTNADRLRQLFIDLDRLDFDAVASHCSDDCVYDDIPFAEATVTGPAAIRAKLEMGLGTLERIPTTIHELVESGDTIMVERTEVWHHRSGERATLRVAAVFKFRGRQAHAVARLLGREDVVRAAAGELAARRAASVTGRVVASR